MAADAIKPKTLTCAAQLHGDVKKHIVKFRKGVKLEAWVAEALQEKMKREKSHE